MNYFVYLMGPELFCAKIPRQNLVCRGCFYSQGIFIHTEYVNKKLSQKEMGLTFWKPLLKAAEKSAIIFYDFLSEKSVFHARSRASPEHASHFVRAWSNTDIDFSIIINILYFPKKGLDGGYYAPSDPAVLL